MNYNGRLQVGDGLPRGKLFVRHCINCEQYYFNSELDRSLQGPACWTLRICPRWEARGRQTSLSAELPPRLRDLITKGRVTVVRYKPCVNPRDMEDRSRHLPAVFTEYVLVSVSETPPSFHVTDDYVDPTLDAECPEVDVIGAHQIVRGCNG